MNIPDIDPTPEPEIFFTAELLRFDIDGDNDIDILTYNNFGEPLELLENDNNVEFKDPVTLATSEHIGGDPILIQILDLNDDQVNDILFGAESGVISIMGQGGLNFDQPLEIYSGDNHPLSMDVADFNSDGFPDFILGTRNIIAGSSLGETILYAGSGSGFSAHVLNSGPGYHHVAFANVDNAGQLDYVTLHADGLFWGTILPDLSFTSIQVAPPFLSNGRFQINDVNSDGDDDIILYRVGSNSIYYYLNGESSPISNECPTQGVYLHNQEQVDRFLERYGACAEINHNLYIGRQDNDWADIVDLSALQNITRIRGDLTLQLHNVLDDLTGFASLEKIDGSFIINGYKSSSFAGMENLRYIGGDFDLFNVATVGTISADLHELANLDTIGRSIIIEGSNVSTLEHILQPVVHGDLFIEFVNTMSDPGPLSVLDSIKGTLHINRSKFNTLDNLGGLQYVEEINIADNSGLHSVSIGDSIANIPGDVRIQKNGYLDLKGGLQNLSHIGGDLLLYLNDCNSFDKLKNSDGSVLLNIENYNENAFRALDTVGASLTIVNYSYDNLERFKNLRFVGDYLGINSNDISSLEGIDSIRNELTDLSISRNPNLLTLDHLHDSIAVSDEWTMEDNPLLTHCDVIPLCRHLGEGRPVKISGNGPDCRDVSEVRCTENIYSGFVYYDLNNNQVKDPQEAPLPNMPVVFNSGPDTILTSYNGYFFLHAQGGDAIDVELLVPTAWAPTTPTFYSTDSFAPGSAANYNNNFGLLPVEQNP